MEKSQYSSGKVSISDWTPETGSEEPTCGESSELEEASSSAAYVEFLFTKFLTFEL